MGLLLFLSGCLALLSGAMKIRERIRRLLGSSWLPYVETAVGAIVVFGSAVGLARYRAAAWSAVGIALAVTLLSTSVQVRRARRVRDSYRQSEADRLRSFLNSRSTEPHV